MSDESSLAAGDVICGYRIVRKLGAGGMGEVYLAEQGSPVSREVALKVVKRGLSGREALARFDAERRALSMLNHRHIAKVLDAGETDDGLPFFVMEYVPGENITAYCDRHSLNVEERVRLLIQACEGIQHSHQKGIIHRDLKPGNVLVVPGRDGKGEVKIIDFGVAKSTRTPLTEQTFQTRMGVLVGTPHYASPEQVAADVPDLDTRADVYALGVILYELITGVAPIDATRFEGKSLLEIQRLILKERRIPPASRFKHLDASEAKRIAKARRTDPHRLRKMLAGDLGFIVIKALRIRRDKRYASVFALLADLARYLSRDPVAARPPGRFYIAHRFALRHPWLVGANTVLILGLAVWAIVATDKLASAGRERSANREQLKDARAAGEPIFNVLGSINPATLTDGRVEANQIVRALARRYEEVLENAPGGIAQALLEIARNWDHVDPDLASNLLLRAIEYTEKVEDHEVRLALEADVELARAGIAAASSDGLDAAAEHASLSGELHRAIDDQLGYAEATLFLADIYYQKGQFEAADESLDEVAKIASQHHQLLLNATLLRARMLADAGEYRNALTMLDDLDPGVINSPVARSAVDGLRSGILADAGEFKTAMALLSELVEKRREQGDPIDLASALIDLANVKRDYGDLASAVELAQEAAATDVHSPQRGLYSNYLALIHTLAGNLDYAERLFATAEVEIAQAYGEDSDFIGANRQHWALLALAKGETDKAFKLISSAAPLLEAVFGKENWRMVVNRALLALARLQSGDTSAHLDLASAVEELARRNHQRFWLWHLSRAYLDATNEPELGDEQRKRFQNLATAPVERS